MKGFTQKKFTIRVRSYGSDYFEEKSGYITTREGIRFGACRQNGSWTVWHILSGLKVAEDLKNAQAVSDYLERLDLELIRKACRVLQKNQGPTWMQAGYMTLGGDEANAEWEDAYGDINFYYEA